MHFCCVSNEGFCNNGFARVQRSPDDDVWRDQCGDIQICLEFQTSSYVGTYVCLPLESCSATCLKISIISFYEFSQASTGKCSVKTCIKLGVKKPVRTGVNVFDFV